MPSAHMRHKMHLFLVPEHVLELVLDQLRVSDCAACCCTSTELRTLSQASCKPIAYLRLPIRVDLSHSLQYRDARR